MNTLQLIKARTTRTRAMQRARLQMAKAFGSADHIDAPTHRWELDRSHNCVIAAWRMTRSTRIRRPPAVANFAIAA